METQMLQEILDYHLPNTWQPTSYLGHRYKLIEMTSRDHEYQQVTAAFGGMRIARVERIQNPFMLGRFKIRKELLALSGSVRESTAFHPISPVDVIKVAEHNCDTRRYVAANGAQRDEKNPKFFSTPQSAWQMFCAYDSSYGGVVIVVVKILNADTAWDSQYLPEYLVYLR